MSSIALYLLLTLRPFETDFCTSWSEGTFRDRNKWAHCCVAHDLHYWAGGSKNDRLEADKGLRSCVTKAHSKAMGDLMFLGVRAGRLSPIKFKAKGWGFAWPKTRTRYQALNTEEIYLVRDELYDNHPHVELEAVDVFIQQLKDRQN